MPSWLTSSLPHSRRATTLGPKASSRQGPLSVGHVHAWPMQMSRAAHKMMVRKVSHRPFQRSPAQAAVARSCVPPALSLSSTRAVVQLHR